MSLLLVMTFMMFAPQMFETHNWNLHHAALVIFQPKDLLLSVSSYCCSVFTAVSKRNTAFVLLRNLTGMGARVRTNEYVVANMRHNPAFMCLSTFNSWTNLPYQHDRRQP